MMRFLILVLLDEYIALHVAPGYHYTVLLHDKRIMSRMAAPFHSEIPISYLDVEYPKANEIVLTYIRQKMLITIDKEDHTCNDDPKYSLRWVFLPTNFNIRWDYLCSIL